MKLRLANIVETAIAPALALLGAPLDSTAARLMLLAIGLQESRFEFRRQLGDGPARGFWQFERGTAASRGGVWGVYLHSASRGPLYRLCAARGGPFEPAAIWTRLETDDVLAAGLARLMLWTSPKALPALDDAEGAWDYYVSTWRPGKPHRHTWDAFHAQAFEQVTGATLK